MHCPFGRAGRARGVEPEAGFVGRGLGRRELLAGNLQQLGESQTFDDRISCHLPGQDHMLQRRYLAHQWFQLGPHHVGYEQRTGAAVAQHVLVIIGRQQGVDGHRNHAGQNAAQKRHRPVDGVDHAQQHALFRLHAQGDDGVGKAIGALGQLTVAVTAGVIDEGNLVAAPGLQVALDQVISGVVLPWKIDTGRVAAAINAAELRHGVSFRCAQLAPARWPSHRQFRPAVFLCQCCSGCGSAAAIPGSRRPAASSLCD